MQQGSELPDDTLLSDVLLTTRAEKIAHIKGIKTVGDLRKMSDADLLKIGDCGKRTVLEFRLLTGQLKPGQKKRVMADKVLKISWLALVAKGECECSFENWKQNHDNAAGQ